MLKINKIALACAVVLSITNAYASENSGSEKNTTKNNETIQKEEPVTEADYPSVPARYLRPGAAEHENVRNKVADLNTKLQSKVGADKSVKTQKIESKKANAVPEKPLEPVDQVRINTDSTIAMRPGTNVFIPISREHPNRLLTPFKNPQIVSTTLLVSKKKGECGEACVRDGVIYITTDQPSAVTAFITEKGHEDIAFSVTMIPQAIPPREVRFTLPTDVMEKLASHRGTSNSSAKKAQAWETSQPYVETIRQSLRSVALGQIPSGYSLRNMKVTDPVPTCKHPGLSFNWDKGQVMEGFNLDIMVGVVRNVADTPVEFRNQNCGGWKTAAVTTWPLTVLQPGQESEIYVVVKREDEIPNEMVRKPLINRVFD